MTATAGHPIDHASMISPLYGGECDDFRVVTLRLGCDAFLSSSVQFFHQDADPAALRVTAFPDADSVTLCPAAVDEFLAKLRMIRHRMPTA